MSTILLTLNRQVKWPLFLFLCLSVMGGISTALVAGENNDVLRVVPHIGAYEALELFKSGRIILLDVHVRPGKTRSDIVGAFYIPPDKLDRIKLNVPEKMVVGVFCD